MLEGESIHVNYMWESVRVIIIVWVWMWYNAKRRKSVHYSEEMKSHILTNSVLYVVMTTEALK